MAHFLQYAAAKWTKTRDKIKHANNVDKSNVGDQATSKDSFDKGWEDGFTGKASRADSFTNFTDKNSYQQGYRLGARDRDFERAKKLRADHLKRQRHQKQMAEYHRADEDREI